MGDGKLQEDEKVLTDKFVRGSTRRLRLMSTSSPYLYKKSAPIIGLAISANVKMKGKSLRNPKLTLRYFFPNVGIVVPLAAVRMFPVSRLHDLNFLIGSTDISAPLSIKKCRLFTWSMMKRRLDGLLNGPLYVVAITGLFSLTV